ncbi:MAG: cob(I)yrinic acid a,c-diamide adenosyltransferase [Bacteroidales bacterium]
MESWKIYTKTGDKGETSLIGGKRVPKDHIRIEAYGTVDELNSFVGLIRSQDINPHYQQVLLDIQENLFVAESLLAKDEGEVKVQLPCVKEDDITMLEKEIDKMNEELPELKNFILPGGHISASYAHVARCVCRRAERIIITLSSERKVPEIILRYINRLSDYFFVLARKLSHDKNTGDILWKSRPCS